MKNEYYKDYMKNNNWNDPEMEKRRQRGRIWGGLILIAGGVLWLAHAMGVIFPAWLFTWPTILIFIGIYMLGRDEFRKPGGFILLAIGGVFLFEQMNPSMHIRHIFWPAIIILVGVSMLFNPWKNLKRKKMEEYKNSLNLGNDESDGDYLNVNAVFGGVEKNMISKNFTGGQVNCIFGGSEINLTQVDFNGTAILELNCVFGGIELAVPSNWKVKSEITVVLGGVSDKRQVSADGGDINKVLVLKGNAIFGGVEIKSYI